MNEATPRMRAPEETFARARRLRRELTLPEVLFWRALRRKGMNGLRFRRQHPMGSYVLDFYLPAARLAVEIDGVAHDMGSNPAHDAWRDAWLATRGVRVLRLLAADVLDDTRRESALRFVAEEARLRLDRPPPPSLRSAPPP